MEACYDDEVSNCEISGGICESNSLAYIIFWGGGGGVYLRMLKL